MGRNRKDRTADDLERLTDDEALEVGDEELADEDVATIGDPTPDEPAPATQAAAAAPANEEPVASTEPQRVVLLYDGEIPEARFPVQTPEGWIYVFARKGGKTAPLDAEVAAVLLEAKKGFSLATS